MRLQYKKVARTELICQRTTI